MSLSIAAVDRLFSRLSATYGAAWERGHGTIPLGDLKGAWAHELAGFASNLESLAWALENLPERCPNPIEFKHLARRAPVGNPGALKLPEPPADPERVRRELAKLGNVIAAPQHHAGHRAWAYRSLERKEAGELISSYSLKLAREVVAMGAH